MHKIVHLIHRDDIGGGGTVVIQHLRHYGNKYETWVLHGSSGIISEACRDLNIRHVRIPIDTKLKSVVGLFFAIRWLRKIKPDLLILHGQWAGPVGAIAGKLARVPRMIYIAHWPSFYTDWDLYRTVRNYLAEWVPIHLCNRAVTLSHTNRYQYLIRNSNIEDKITSLSNMMDLGKVPPPERMLHLRDNFHWDSGYIHVVSVGRITTQKRINWLLKSWKVVHDSGAKARLWIVGGGDLLDEMKQLAGKLGIETSCTFLGPQVNGIDFIAASDVVAMTTVYEGNALIPMEAMACGKPIVANAADGVRDTFADGREGFLVHPGNISLFAERLLTLINDPELRSKMGEAGKKYVPYYDADKVLERYVMLIELELAKKNNPYPETNPSFRDEPFVKHPGGNEEADEGD